MSTQNLSTILCIYHLMIDHINNLRSIPILLFTLICTILLTQQNNWYTQYLYIVINPTAQQDSVIINVHTIVIVHQWQGSSIVHQMLNSRNWFHHYPSSYHTLLVASAAAKLATIVLLIICPSIHPKRNLAQVIQQKVLDQFTFLFFSKWDHFE